MQYSLVGTVEARRITEVGNVMSHTMKDYEHEGKLPILLEGDAPGTPATLLAAGSSANVGDYLVAFGGKQVVIDGALFESLIPAPQVS